MIRLLAIFSVLAFTGWLSLGSIERWILYPFTPTHVAPMDTKAKGIVETEMSINGETTVVWTAPPKPGKPVIFYLHGNAGNLADRAGRFQRFMNRGYGIVAPAYPGSSGSTGTPSQAAITDVALQVWRAVPSLLTQSNSTGKAPLVLFGESLGTGVSIQLVAQLTDQDDKPAAILLEAPFLSIDHILQDTYPQYEAALEFLSDHWRSVDLTDHLTAPLLVMHGKQDTLISFKQGQQIYKSAPAKHKTFVSVTDAGHTDLWRSDTLPKLWSFIDRYAATKRR